MEIIDNINNLLGDNLKQTLKPGSKLKIAASCFSIYAFEALKKELESIESLEFIFTSPTFVPNEVTDKLNKEHRQYHIPKTERERSFYGSEFEIQLKNKLTQRAIAKECADWVRRKASFRSNRGTAPMQQFAGVQTSGAASIYMPLHGFTAVDLGYQRGDAVSNIVNKFDEPAHTGVFLNLFDQIWNDQEKLEDVTTRICDHIASVYQENSPERIYFLMLYNIFNEFLEDLNEDDLPNDRTGYQDSLIWQKLFNFQKDAANSSFSPHPSSLRYAIDFDQLRQELSTAIVEGPQERYQLNWPGKREALLTANAPIAKTLRPCREESVDFDTTQNLYIEGDNLDALKLLQETYLNKVKMIYIDPPYNTGNDFIYEDDFAEDSEAYLERSNQKDELGKRMVANTEANGRFHSDWLSMMYSRLKLARNLLRDDGVIFISIDDNEQANLKRLCDEIFGEANFLAQIMWQKMYSGKADATHFGRFHEYVICYARSIDTAEILLLPRTAEMNARYSNPDNDSRGDWLSNDLTAAGERSAGHYEIFSPSGIASDSPQGKHWLYSKETMQQLLEDNRIYFGKNGDAFPRLKRFLTEVQQGRRVNTIWLHDEVGHTDEGTKELKKLFDSAVDFSAPKPTRLLKQILSIASKPNDIILDFFSGSSTTAHAVMQLNVENSGKRKFIMVQLPEACDEKCESYKAGYKTIADIGKERIRRAGKKIKDENALTAPNLDIGFRVLKIDSSNMKDVYYAPDAVKQGDLLAQVDNICEDRTPEDLLFQVLLDWGVDLALPITQESIAGKNVFFVDGNALAACFETGINEEFVKALAARHPLRAVFRDAGFGSDSVKINIEQIFKLISPTTELKSI